MEQRGMSGWEPIFGICFSSVPGGPTASDSPAFGKMTVVRAYSTNGSGLLAAGVRPKATVRERCDGALSDLIPHTPCLLDGQPHFPEFGSRSLKPAYSYYVGQLFKQAHRRRDKTPPPRKRIKSVGVIAKEVGARRGGGVLNRESCSPASCPCLGIPAPVCGSACYSAAGRTSENQRASNRTRQPYDRMLVSV